MYQVMWSSLTSFLFASSNEITIHYYNPILTYYSGMIGGEVGVL